MNLVEAKAAILDRFKIFANGGSGIEGWICENAEDVTFERLSQVQMRPMTVEQMN
jgi:hypothetical protein